MKMILLNLILLLAMSISSISTARLGGTGTTKVAKKSGDKTCKLQSLVAYMDERCTIPYRNIQALGKSREEVDRFIEAALYATG